MAKQNSNSYGFNFRTLDQKSLRAREAFLDAVAKGDDEKLNQISPEDQRAFVNYPDHRSGNMHRTAIIYASQNFKHDLVKHLIGLGADVNARDAEGWSALNVAVSNGDIWLIETLLDNKADINIRDNEEWTPLMEAIQHGLETVAGLLLERGADVRPRNNEGMRALDMAVDFGHDKIANLIRPIQQKLDTDDSVIAMRSGTKRKINAPAPARFRKAG